MKTLSTSLRTGEYGANFFSWGYYFSAGYFCYKKFNSTTNDMRQVRVDE